MIAFLMKFKAEDLRSKINYAEEVVQYIIRLLVCCMMHDVQAMTFSITGIQSTGMQVWLTNVSYTGIV